MSRALAALRRVNRRLLPGHLLTPPSWIILGVNNACNLHCRMCDVGTKDAGTNFYQHMVGTRPMNMPRELLLRVVDQVATHYPSARIGFAFTEPSLYPHLTEGVAAARERGVGSSLTTNGLLLERQAAGLAEAGLGELVVSIDGPPALHDQIRGRPGAFATARAGLERWVGIPSAAPVAVFTAITRWNIGALEETLRQFINLPLARFGFMHTVFATEAAAAAHNRRWAQYPATGSNLADLELSGYDLDALWSEITSLRSRTWPFPVSFSPTFATRDELEHYYLGATPYGRRCADAFENLLVKSDGTVVPAHSRCFPVVAGNLHEAELPDIWNGPVLAAFRRDLVRAGGLFPGCSRCCSAR